MVAVWMGPVESRTREARDLQAGGTGREETAQEGCLGRIGPESHLGRWRGGHGTQAVAHGAKSRAEKSQALKG